MAPTWLLPKQALVHFPVGFWLTTGILLLSNPGAKFCCLTICSQPSQDGPAKTQYACQYNDSLDNLAKGFRIHSLHDRHGKQDPQYHKGHAKKHIVEYFSRIEASRSLHGAGNQNAQKEV